MTTKHASLFIALQASGQDIPSEIHLVPAGTFKGADGRGPYTVEDADALIRNSMAAGKLAIDENHAIDLAAPMGQPAPARGWITDMHARADGIWGTVEWTPSGRALMAEKAYRGISPVIAHNKAGKILQVLRASLTNDPNLSGLKTLHSKSPEISMDLMAQIRSMLQLDNDADDNAVIAAVQALSKQVSTQSQQKADTEAVRIALNAKAGEDLVAAIKALQAKAAEADTLATSVQALETKVTTLQSAHARAEAEKVVDAAIGEGKPVKALRDHYITRHMKDPEGVKKEIDALPSLHSGGINPDKKTSALVGEGATEREITKAAQAYQAEEKAKGRDVDWGLAVMHVTGR